MDWTPIFESGLENTMAKYEGVRERVPGKRYEVSWRPHKGAARIFRNVEAASISEAYYKRQELMADHAKNISVSDEDRKHLTAGFAEIWESVEKDVTSDKRAKKTIGRYKKVYWRLFGEFREKIYPSVDNPNQLSSAYFTRYKIYYATDLNKQDGWRAELIIVKAIMKRMYKLGYCGEDLINKLKEFKTPKGNKKEFPNVSDSKIKELFTFIKNDRPDYYRPLEFIRRTGRRRREVTLIRKDDVILNGLRPIAINIRAETTKTRQKAPLNYLDEDLTKLIQSGLSGNKTEWLFPNRVGRCCNPDKLYQYIKRVSLEKIGVELTPHYFRHRFFTECGKGSLPIADVQAISGIKDTKVLFEYYSHSTEEGQAKVLEKTRL